MFPLALAASDDADAWEARLHAWFDGTFAPTAVAWWSGAQPEANYRRVATARQGADAAVYPQSCAAFLADLHFDATENGYTQADVAHARADLGPAWASVPAGFDAPAVIAGFRRHPGAASLGAHLTVAVTHLPAGLDAHRMFEAGIAQGCGVAKMSYAFLWSGDTLVRLDSPCSEGDHFAPWTSQIADALATWTGQPLVEPFVYGKCGTIAVRWATRAEIGSGVTAPR
jgi:hypothetical protein